jgi:hypothetical protein
MAQMVLGARLLTGRNVVPRGIRFVHPEPEDTREHRECDGCPLLFRAPANDIEFSLEDAALPRPCGASAPWSCSSAGSPSPKCHSCWGIVSPAFFIEPSNGGGA